MLAFIHNEVVLCSTLWILSDSIWVKTDTCTLDDKTQKVKDRMAQRFTREVSNGQEMNRALGTFCQLARE